MTNNKDETCTSEQSVSERSEEVQTIIDRMPTRGATWVAMLVGVLICIVIILGFIIKYPDTVDGQITITARYAPVRLVANSTGKMYLLAKNNSNIKEGTVIAYIESGVNYIDLLAVDSLLSVYNTNSPQSISVPTSMTLGEISSAFSAFVVAHLQYVRFLSSDIYETQKRSLYQQIGSAKGIVDNMHHEDVLKKRMLLINEERTKKDSLLLKKELISEDAYLRQHTEYLTVLDDYEAFTSERMSNTSQLYQLQFELLKLKQEEQETADKLLADLQTSKNELSNLVRIWKETYLLYAPIDGNLEFLEFWRENSYVQTGQELFSIIPSKKDMQGEVMIPALGVGKVQVGQTANIKVDNYPYDEYGMIKGKVESISRLTHKLQMTDGSNINVYSVMIIFPDGLRTNFGKTLMLDFESMGSVEIITKPKRLIERLFDNLKSKTEK